ncbi:MAG: hypothetical protein ACOYX1_12570 [Acidobacteriota bacterium]
MPERRASFEAEPAASSALPLIGRQRELHALGALFAQGSRVLVLGPRGIGKTRLIQESAAAAGISLARPDAHGSLHEFLEGLLPLTCTGTIRPASVRRLSSQTLQSRALAALQSRPRWLWIDDPAPAGARLYRFLQRVLWIRGCGLAVCAQNREQLGYLGRLLWDPREEVRLRPLSRHDAARLMREAMRASGLESRGCPEDFLEQVLDAAAGNPGRIVTLCRLAAQPQYWHGGHLMFAPLWIDTLTRLA